MSVKSNVSSVCPSGSTQTTIQFTHIQFCNVYSIYELPHYRIQAGSWAADWFKNTMGHHNIADYGLQLLSLSWRFNSRSDAGPGATVLRSCRTYWRKTWINPPRANMAIYLSLPRTLKDDVVTKDDLRWAKDSTMLYLFSNVLSFLEKIRFRQCLTRWLSNYP